MIEIKEGPELDRAVAIAVGFRRVIQIGPKPDFSQPPFLDTRPAELVEVGADDERMPKEIIPNYSSNLNMTFAAANKVSDYFVLNKCEFTEGKWDCKLVATDLATEWYRADTPALAICAAILEAKKRK